MAKQERRTFTPQERRDLRSTADKCGVKRAAEIFGIRHPEQVYEIGNKWLKLHPAEDFPGEVRDGRKSLHIVPDSKVTEVGTAVAQLTADSNYSHSPAEMLNTLLRLLGEKEQLKKENAQLKERLARLENGGGAMKRAGVA